MAEEKDQAQTTEQSETKTEETKAVEETKEPETAQEVFDAGFEKFGDEIAGEEEKVAPPVKKAEQKEEECIGCGKDIKDLPTEVDKINWEKVDYNTPDYPKPLKEDGKVVWVKDADDMATRAMKGDDYTRKRQVDADDKRTFEEEKGKAIGEIESLAEKLRADTENLNNLAKFIYKNPEVQAAVKEQEKEAGTRELTEDEILQTFGIDTDDLTVDDFTKKLALDNYAIKQGQKKSDERFVEEKRKTDFIVLEKFAGGIVHVANEARKQYPYEEVMGVDEAGKPVNKTAVYFTTEMLSRIKAQEGRPESERRQAGDIAVDLVKEIHEMQKGTTSSKEGTVDLSNLTLDEINAKIKEARPELFGEDIKGNDKGEKTVTDQSSADEKTKSVPSLRSENRAKVDLDQWRKQRGADSARFTSPQEGIDKAFEEIDFDAE